ncbi:MAG: FecR family protein, partial [Candidatus Adiutricales bacterium]
MRLGTPIYQNDRIRTENRAKVRIVFVDQSIISIGSKSALTISEYVFNPKQKIRSTRLRLLWGKVKVYANDFMGFRKKKFAVATNTTIVGVRGTVFLVWIVNDQITRVVAFQNEVEVASRFAPDEYIVLKPNQMTQVLAGEAPAQPMMVTPEQLKELQEGLLVEDQQISLTTVGTTIEDDTTEKATTEQDTTEAT